MNKIKKLKYLTEDVDRAIEEGKRIEGLSYEYYNLQKSINPLIDKINEIIEVLNKVENITKLEEVVKHHDELIHRIVGICSTILGENKNEITIH